MTTPNTSGAADLPEALRPVEPGALIASIQELNAWESRADGELLTQAEGESIILVLHELKRLIALAAGQDPSQPGGFSSGDMASAAAQGFRDGWTAAQADSAEPAGAGYAALPDAKTLGEAVAAWIGVETRGAHNWVDTTVDRLGFAVRSVMGDMLRASHGQAPAQIDQDGETFRTAACLGLTLRFYGGCAQSGMPGTPSAYEVVPGQDRADAMREAVGRAAAVIASGGESQRLNATPSPQAAQQAPAKLVEAVTKAILFEDTGSSEGWEENTNLGEAAIRVCDARNPPRCSYCHSATGAPLAAPTAMDGGEDAAPIDNCTDPYNCKRCKAHPNHRAGLEHAGIPAARAAQKEGSTT